VSTSENPSPSPSQDQADVESVLAGDTSAFAGIVHRWQGPLVNLAYRFCRDRGRAEEMAQEAFVRAYRGLAQWRGEAAFSTWLFALAINVYRSELRRFPPSALSLDEIAEPVDARVSGGALQRGLEERQRDKIVRRAVLALPQKYKEALLLFYFQQKDVAAAARILQLPEGTVKARLARGRALLRRKLQAWDGGSVDYAKEEACAKESI
jgi:RNA polymerase sigma-70 factor (ECF subfamily)